MTRRTFCGGDGQGDAILVDQHDDGQLTGSKVIGRSSLVLDGLLF